MKKSIFILTAVLLFTACTKKPDYVLSHDQMINIITDLQIHDAACQTMHISAIEDPDTYSHFYNQIFDKYDVESAVFDSSLRWYTKNATDELRTIYSKADKNIKKMSEKLESEK